MGEGKAGEQDRGREQGARTRAPVAAAEPPVARPRRRRHEVAFALAAPVVVLGLLEVVLRVLGFRFEPVPILVDTTWGQKQVQAMNEDIGANIFRRDELTFWSLKPGARLDVRQVNERGLLGAPVRVPKPEGTYRILCLGDSCTAQGPGPYSLTVERRLKALERPGRRFEVINAGCFGYTSFQGHRLFRERLGDLQPDLVTTYFGWNDHYLTGGYPDNLLRSRDVAAPRAVRILRPLRLYQFVHRAVHTAQMSNLARKREGKRLVRVAPEDYRANLASIVDLARARAARVLMLTAPGNHAPGHVPAFLIEEGFAESEETLIAYHRRYNQVVRDVAAAKKVDLLDLEARFNERDKDALFLDDGIHPDGAGRRLIGRLLVEAMGATGILTPDEQRQLAARPAYDSVTPNVLRSRVEFPGAPLRVAAGRSLELVVRLTNTGDTLWLSRPETLYGQVRLGVLIHDARGRPLPEGERAALPRDVPPGETVEVRWVVGSFDRPGAYVLEVDPVAELVTWFNEQGDEHTTCALIVEPAGQ